MKKAQLLNLLILKYGYKSYLEIGTQYTHKNFDLIMCEDKVGVDPFPLSPTTHQVTSDEYFSKIANGRKFDLIFVDGLHHSEQVVKDIVNSISHLNDNGRIVIHDCLPTTYEMQVRNDHGGEWTGDVWKAIVLLRTFRDDLFFTTYDMDYGCCVIKRAKSKLYIPHSPSYMDWNYFDQHRKDMMNIVDAPSLDCINI